MRKKIFTFLLALAASVGMMNAKVTWKSCNISDLDVHGTYHPYSKEGVTLSANSDFINAYWQNYGDESHDGIFFMTDETGGFTFSNTLGKNFTKIEMTLRGSGGWDMANLGSGWNIVGDPWDVMKAIWTGNASSTVDLLEDESHFHGENVKRIEFYFEGDSEEPDPTYTVALQDGTANADKVTLSATSAEECTTVTVTPNEEYEITAFKATYNTTEELSTSFNAETDAYSFTMPAANVTIEATIALKPVPEGDIFAGFTATAGSGGFDNEGHANLVDNEFTSADWTKWCTNFDHMSVPTGETGDACWWIDFEASAALNLTGYILTTGNDTGNEHGRNPKNWVLKAKLNADDAWTTIATVTNDVTMKNQSFKDYKFFVDQSGTYQYFRFEVFANQGAGVMQLCELRLIGTEPAPANPVIKLNANFGGTNDWADTEAFTDNGDGTASWSISTLTAGSWYNFGVKVDGTWTSDHAAFSRENPSRVVSGTGEAMWFQADVAGEYTFTWEYATNTLTIGYPEIHTYTAVGQSLPIFGNSWDPSITDNDLVLQEDGSYKWEKNVSFTGAITIQYRVCEDHAWGVAYPATSEQPASFEIPSLGDYKITITYNPVGNVISASAEKIAKPTIQLNGNFSGEWADTEAFEVVEQPMDSYAKLTKLLEPGTYEFGVKVNGEWRANGSAYTRDNYSYIIEEGHTGNLTINVDVKGYYSFYWYYDNNRLIIDYSRVCGMYWKDVTAGNFEVTLGQEGEVTLPKVWATSMAFVSNIANGADQVRLGSTDETVATIAYTLSLDGLGTLTFHQAGECDIYVVHDITNLYCYDSCAFHLTVHPAPTTAEDVNITPNVDPDHAGVYYSTFFDSENKYSLPAGVEAYVATLDGANLLLTKIADAGQTIPADNAVIFKSTVTPFTLSISDAEAVSVNTINSLQGTDVSIDTPANCYVLAGTNGVGFYHYTASKLNAHKAYVIYSGTQAPGRMRFIFDQATGVENVQGDKVQSTKMMENGVLYIIKNGVKYNAQGQIVK